MICDYVAVLEVVVCIIENGVCVGAAKAKTVD